MRKIKYTLEDLVNELVKDKEERKIENLRSLSEVFTREGALSFMEKVKDIAANMDTDTWMHKDEVVYAIDLGDIDKRLTGLYYIENHCEDNHCNLNFVEYYFTNNINEGE